MHPPLHQEGRPRINQELPRYNPYIHSGQDLQCSTTQLIQLSLRKNAKRTSPTKNYDWALFNNSDIRDKYVLELKNRFETLQEKTEKSTPNNEYENFVNAHLKAAAKCIPTKLKTKYRVP